MLAPFSLNQMMREMDSMFPSGFGVDTTLPKLAVDIRRGLIGMLSTPTFLVCSQKM